MLIFLFFLFVSAPAAEGQLRIVDAEWSLSDDFESSKDEKFWARGVSVVHGAESEHGKSKVLQFTYEKDKPEAGHGWSEQRFAIPIKAQQLEISYKLYVPANYKNSGKNHKSFVLWSGTYGKSRANVSVSSENWGVAGGATPSIYIGVNKKNYGHTRVKGNPLMLKDGKAEWIDVHIYLELAKKPGAFGRFEIHRNGTLITGNHHTQLADDKAKSWRPKAAEQIVYSTLGNFIDQGYLLGWMNGGVSEKTVFLIDDFQIKANSKVGAAQRVK